MGPARSRPDHRIIPARAGFTGEPPPGRRPGRDHPRSRGVYPSPTCPTPTRSGSSPLARGLLSADAIHTIRPGIIPARAGFTCPPVWPTGPASDHPRSRGVYPSPRTPRAPPAGSSPLARGLRLPVGAGEAHPGIIPARAGFTGASCDHPGCEADHPRSRGVYSAAPGSASHRRGSSPLARGLRDQDAAHGLARRIIPARAGFTAPPPRPRSPTEDHPRSRGVYGPPGLPGGAQTGSSPLARGLHQGGGDLVQPLGIIPARAGFTTAPTRTSVSGPDHPRSRGVYSTWSSARRTPSGSSPLARGLRWMRVR